MKIERNFFTESQEQMQKYRRESELERLKMTQEELAAEKAMLEASFHGLKERAALRAQSAKLEYDPVCHYTFLEIVEKAQLISEYFSMDLTVTLEKGLPGKITLATSLLTINELCLKPYREYFFQMLAAANEILIKPADGLIEILLYYDVYKWSDT